MAAGDSTQFDPVTFLAAHGIRGEAGPVRATGGADTEVWRTVTTLGPVAVRAFRVGEGSRASREAAAMAAARRAGVPVPPTWLRGVSHGRPVAVIGWVPGRTVLEALRLAPWQAWHLGVAFGEVQARLHRMEAPPSMPGPEAWIDLMDWGDRGGAGSPWPTSGARVRDALHADAATAPRALLHLDFHPANVLVDGVGRVTGVIDWANAVAGPPVADLARTWAIFATALVPPGWGAATTRVVLRVLVSAWQSGYRRAGGVIPGRGAMAPWVAWAARWIAAEAVGREGPSTLVAASARRWVASWRA
jgi:aminoglycoside phosphotransferase (APT) family kinase protein